MFRRVAASLERQQEIVSIAVRIERHQPVGFECRVRAEQEVR